MKELVLATIKSSCSECDSHLKIMKKAANRIQPILPLTENGFTSLDENNLAYLDQFLFRFTKLQDSMAKRLIPALYSYLEDNDQQQAFLNIINKLEKLGVLTSVQEWQFFRSIRNNLAHDYPESIKQSIEILNLLLSDWDKLEEMFIHLKKHCP